MRAKKSYNIRNIEAHMNNFQVPMEQINSLTNDKPIQTLLLNKNMIFQNNASNNIIHQPLLQEQLLHQYPLQQQGQTLQQRQTLQQQQTNEIINAKYGVSRYASNLVSGKMFKKI